MSWYNSAPKKSSESERSSLKEPSVSELHHQIEDLLSAISQMQREAVTLKDELMQAKLDKMDVEAERDALKITIESAFNNVKYEKECMELRKENSRLKQEKEELVQQQIMSKDALSALVERMLDMKNKVDHLEQENKRITRECQILKKERPKSIASICNNNHSSSSACSVHKC
ncbi:hypothetical protein RMATCC62417_03568 [Rhizopus microsporus]|nr:hypothetical protein RMATCC62417_03568 [Rhizopus microsporus]